MKTATLFAAVLAAALGAGFLNSGAIASAETTPDKPSECCLDRDSYIGMCRVTPGEGETCDSILTYLNTPGSVGKLYCGGNKLRGGWRLVDCAKPEADEEKK